MIARMQIYTRTGDDGTTGLVGGSRTRKDELRLDCYGTVDELNAALGVAAAAGVGEAMFQRLARVQNELFVVGSHLATPDAAGDRIVSTLPPLDESMVQQLEMEIDAADDVLPPLRNFILPGGTDAAARLHLARTVCRRAERLVVRFAMDRPVAMVILVYLNRLSDWLFVQARLANHAAGVADVPWVK